MNKNVLDIVSIFSYKTRTRPNNTQKNQNFVGVVMRKNYEAGNNR